MSAEAETPGALPELPAGHPDPVTAGDLLSGAFQWAYVTNDFDGAKTRLDATFGINWLQMLEGEPRVPGRTRAGETTMSARVGLGMLGDGPTMIELIEPQDDPTGMFSDALRGAPAGTVAFHHHGVVVRDRRRAIELLAPGGDGPIWTSDGPHGIVFDVFDLRPQLGHFIETIQVGAVD